MVIINFCSYFPEWLQIIESIFAMLGIICLIIWIIKWFIPMGSPADDSQLWSR